MISGTLCEFCDTRTLTPCKSEDEAAECPYDVLEELRLMRALLIEALGKRSALFPVLYGRTT